MGVRHGILFAGILLLIACGDDDEPVGGDDQPSRAAEALQRAMNFNGGQRRDGVMGLASEDRVEVVLASELVMTPGGAGIMPLEVENPIADDKPETAALMQFGEVEQHVRVPVGRSVEGDGNFNFEFEIDADACDGLCAERIEVPITLAIELEGGDISKHEKTTITIDCRDDGDEDACEDAPANRPDGGGNAGSSGGRGGRGGSGVPVDPVATAAAEMLLDAVEEFETEVCSCIPGDLGTECETASSEQRSCNEIVLFAYAEGNEDLYACVEEHFTVLRECVTAAACDSVALEDCATASDGEDNWAAIEERCGDVPLQVQAGIDACEGGEPIDPIDPDPNMRPDSFPCTDGTNLSLDRLCDGAMDCPGGFDEMICIPCSDANGDFSAYDQCDGEDDCSDGSDERSCQYTCSDGDMVLITKLCDGTRDCGDGSDESLCMGGRFQCSGGETIEIMQVCDGTPDCPDGEDETTFCSNDPSP